MIEFGFLKISFYLVVAFLLFLCALKVLCIGIYYKQKQHRSKAFVVGLFHPYCNAGGGGERVLWCAIKAMLNRYPSAHCVIYTGDIEASAKEIIAKAHKTFGISLSSDIEFVFLKQRKWVEACRYPIVTLLGQSLGSMYLGLEALLLNPPDVYLDTMGYAFTLPIFKYLGGCKTGCYVHYPTISTDMLGVVANQTGAFNNRSLIAKSRFLTRSKLMYYRIFACLYGTAGRCADTVMVNSSWTSGHVQEIWKPDKLWKVFPPCDIRGFLDISLCGRYNDELTSKKVLSIGQFRPEKNHALQVKSFYEFLSHLSDDKKKDYQLILAGGCRNEGDEGRVAALRSLIAELQIVDNVHIRTNISYSALKELLSQATVGIHTMANEHFGIGIVEFQAAGVVALAHDSGGPKMDIILENSGENRTGYLADSVSSYSQALSDIFSLSKDDRIAIAERARSSCERFSEKHFEEGFLAAVSVIMDKKMQ